MGWLLLSLTVHLQSATPEDECKQLINADQYMQPLRAHPFGEKSIGTTISNQFEHHQGCYAV